jgi:HK97 family phage prohead protease
MIHGSPFGELELRRDARGGRRLRGRFPYNVTATLSDGGKRGRPRKERISSKAFSYRIERPEEDIHLLVGHDYNKPLASRGAETLVLQDTAEALTFDAQIVPAVLDAPYGRDFLGAFESGMMRGISPGFRIPPPRTVPDAETVEEENPKDGTAIIRTIFAALLYELSLVTVAAYREAFAEEAAAEEAAAEAEAEGRETNRHRLPLPERSRQRDVLHRWRL